MEQHQFGLREWADLCERKDATIAALQARVNGLEKDSELLRQSRDDFRVKYESVKNDAITLQSQLTQRTAELEAARVDNRTYIDERHENMKQIESLQAELERVRGELVGAAHNVNVYQSLYSTSCMDRALLENELRELRTLITALPKVEGAVVVSNGYVKDSTRCHALFGADEDAASYAALLQHRQRVEG